MKISKALHNKLTKDYQKHQANMERLPYCFLLGAKDGVISIAYELKRLRYKTKNVDWN